MPQQKLDSESPPEAFPDIWRADEELKFDINAIINKHVYLALDLVREQARIFCYLWDDRLKIGFDGGEDELLDLEFDLEEIVHATNSPRNNEDREEMHNLAASLRRMADHYDKLASKP